MSWWEAAILGLVQGVTEYLPVSSSGHLVIATWLLGMDRVAHEAAIGAYDVALHGGTVVAVLGLYRERVTQMVRGLLGRDGTGLRLAGQLVVATAPVGLVGVLGRDAIRAHLYGPWPVIAALFVGGAAMVVAARMPRFRDAAGAGAALETLGWGAALAVGLAQCLALWPGMSRAMVSLLAALAVGLRVRAAAELSFLLGMTTIAGAVCLELFLEGETMVRELAPIPVLVGVVVATVSAAAAVYWLVGFLLKRGLGPFGWYRIGLAGLLAAAIGAGVLEAGAW